MGKETTSENIPATTEKKETGIKAMMQKPQVMKRLEEILGKRAATFATSVMQIVNSSELLKTADPTSIVNAAMVSATLDLPLNNQLGFAWIVPFKENKQDKATGKWTSRYVAQFQIGYKGFNQLALRTGQYHAINAIPVYENQFISWNALTEELKADFTIEGEGKVVGYCAYFRLMNGFEKTAYWSKEKATKHGKKYSKSFDKGPWNDDFDGMAVKTVLKLTLAKWGIMSVDMQKAITTDQAVINDDTGEDVTYVDHEEVDEDKEASRFIQFSNECTELPKLVEAYNKCTPELQTRIEEAYQLRHQELSDMEDEKEQGGTK